MSRPRKRPKRRAVEDGSTPAGPSYSHPVEEDEWAENERQRKERNLRRHRLANSDAAKAIDERLRARGITPPSKPL